MKKFQSLQLAMSKPYWTIHHYCIQITTLPIISDLSDDLLKLLLNGTDPLQKVLPVTLYPQANERVTFKFEKRKTFLFFIYFQEFQKGLCKQAKNNYIFSWISLKSKCIKLLTVLGLPCNNDGASTICLQNEKYNPDSVLKDISLSIC